MSHTGTERTACRLLLDFEFVRSAAEDREEGEEKERRALQKDGPCALRLGGTLTLYMSTQIHIYMATNDYGSARLI